MDDARQRTGEADKGRDDLDALIDRALDRMGGAGPIDARARVLARLDGDTGAAGRWWAVWRPAAAVGGIALVVLLAVVMVSRQTVRPAGSTAGPRSAATDLRPVESAAGLPPPFAAQVPAVRPNTGTLVPTRPARSLADVRHISNVGDARPPGRDDELPETQQGAQTALPGAPAGIPGEPIPAMPPPPPILIPAIVPTRIAEVPSVVDLGTPVGILPIVDPARGTSDTWKNGGISP